MRLIFTTVIILNTVFCFAQDGAEKKIPQKDMQIKTAVLAAPQEQREGATVMGYSSKGDLIVLREGTNGMICLADDPAKTRREPRAAAARPRATRPPVELDRRARNVPPPRRVLSQLAPADHARPPR